MPATPSVRQTAQLRYLHIAPRKVRLIADTIRGLPVSEAEAQLMLRPQRAAGPLLKLLRSAVAGAVNDRKMARETLVVGSIRVDQGPMLKRSLPRAMGRATPIHKKASHVVLTLEASAHAHPSRFTVIPKEKKEKKKPAKRPATPRATPAIEQRAAEKPGFFKRIFQRKSV